MSDHTEPVVELELDYTEQTSPTTVTATTAAGADTVVTAGAITVDGATPILVEFFAPYAQTPAGPGGSLKFVAFDGSTQLGEYEIKRTSGGTSERDPVNLRRRTTPSAGSHTYSWRAYVDAGSGLVAAGAGGAGNTIPAFIRITRANPRVVA